MNESEVFSLAKVVLSQNINYDILLQQHESLKSSELHFTRTKKLLAEVSFLLAKECLKNGDRLNARKYADESIELYSDLNIKTLDAAVPELSNLLPEIMHEGVVRENLSDIYL